MQNWKQAFWLARFELNASKKNILFSFVYFLFTGASLISVFSSYLEKGIVLIDFLFLLMFTIGPIWTKPKDFQIQRINSELVAAPAFIMLNQLPIKQDVIIKSRFIIYFAYSFIFQVLLLVSLYAFIPELQSMLSFGTFIIFVIIWISFGIYIGYIFPATDAGEKTTSTKSTIYTVLMVVAAIVVFTIYQIMFQHGIVHWTIIFAQKWPALSTIISIVLAILGYNYWQRYMKKVANKIDYL